MQKVGIIRNKEISYFDIYNFLREKIDLTACGAIISFVGIVRGIGRNGTKVKSLYYECEDEIAIKELNEIRNVILSKYKGVKEILIYHHIGNLRTLDDTIYILVASGHREEGFKAAKECLELVKERVHIWKKEITERGAYWIAGDSIVDL